LIAWLSLFPGLPIAGYFLGVDNPILVLVFLLLALGFLFLTVLAAFAHDIQRQTAAHQAPSTIE